MKKEEIRACFCEKVFLNKLFGYAYKRTSGAQEAEELCAEIILAIFRALEKAGRVEKPYAFAWAVAGHTYADYCETRQKSRQSLPLQEAGGKVFPIEEWAEHEEDAARLQGIFREIAFLAKAYREVMVLYYLDGLSLSAIARKLGIEANAVKQRLFAARNTIRKEVKKMDYNSAKPLPLQTLDYVIWGTGNPAWGDPREVCRRQFAKHIVWLCRKQAKSAKEISEALSVPMPYVEEELEVQAAGANGQYGLLKRLENGKYIANIILLDKEEILAAQGVYIRHIPALCDCVAAHIEKNKEEYLRFPYINKTVTLNLVLWQQISTMAGQFSSAVKELLAKEYFAGAAPTTRPFSVFGYRNFGGPSYGGGWDGAGAHNICGYSHVHAENIYITRIQRHFHCGVNWANDIQLQLALRAIYGLPVSELAKEEEEHAAKAIEAGYLYRENGMLYTKVLVCEKKDAGRLFSLSYSLQKEFLKEAGAAAAEIAALVKRDVPKELHDAYGFYNVLANMPVLDTLVEELINRNLLVPPENGVGAEGCWLTVEK